MGSTGLLIMVLVDFVFAMWLGLTIGFGGVPRGMIMISRKRGSKSAFRGDLWIAVTVYIGYFPREGEV